MYDILQLNDMLVPELLDIAEQLKIPNALSRLQPPRAAKKLWWKAVVNKKQLQKNPICL